MKKLNYDKLKKLWFEFWVSKNHYKLENRSIIPKDDNSLLWINSGVAAIKKYLTHQETPPKNRLVSIQRCIRTNDLKNIGKSDFHHSSFEMMGNFSIGDYFRDEAIEWAYEFLTLKKWLNIDINKLYFTVYKDDKESLDKWKSLGIDEKRIFKMGRETNFWDMGSGPCGPSTEIFFDRGDEIEGIKLEENNPKKYIQGDLDNRRYVEIWNIVFSEFNNLGNKDYVKLPKKNIDTGMGLERMLCVLNNKANSFETDSFPNYEKLIKNIIEIPTKIKLVLNESGIILNKETEKEAKEFSLENKKRFLDYSRTLFHLLLSEVKISNNNRGYVLKQILIDFLDNFWLFSFYKNVKTDNKNKKLMIDDLVKKITHIFKQYSKIQEATVDSSFNNVLNSFKDIENVISSIFSRKDIKKYFKDLLDKKNTIEKALFLLNTERGFTLKEIESFVKKRNIKYNDKKLNSLYEEFKSISKKGSKLGEAFDEITKNFNQLEFKSTEFVGYRDKYSLNSKVLFSDGKYLILDKTIFYATSGGQEHDLGTIDGIKVKDVVKENNFIVHVIDHKFKVGQIVKSKIDKDYRLKSMKNHSSVHLTAKALEKVLNIKFKQLGSKLNNEYFRFDFEFGRLPTKDELLNIEKVVNKWIDEDIKVNRYETDLSKVDKNEIGMLDSSDYKKKVFVIDFPNVTKDLCGGTHVNSTKEIEKIKLIKTDKRGENRIRIIGISTFETIKKYDEETKLKLLDQKINYINEIKTIDNSNEFKTLKNKWIELVKSNVDTDLEKLDLEIQNLNKEKSEKYLNLIREGIENNQNFFQIEFNNISKSYVNIYMKKMLKMSTKDNFVLVLTNKTNDKKTNLIILPTKNTDSFKKRVTEISNSINLRGGGSNRFIQYGGSVKDIDKFNELLKNENWR